MNLSGSLNALGAVTTPSINFSNTSLCTIANVSNINLLLIGNYNTLSLFITVLPSVSSEYCSFEFELPNKINTLSNRGDVIINCSGWNDDTNIIPIFILGVGVTGSTKCILKFQSINTTLHYIQVNCIYTF